MEKSFVESYSSESVLGEEAVGARRRMYSVRNSVSEQELLEKAVMRKIRMRKC